MDYVFKKEETGLKFVGNFNQFYLDISDPWHQSGSQNDPEMSLYYSNARKSLINSIQVALEQTEMKIGRIVEFGCGLGFVTKQIKEKFSNFQVTGVDISEEAIRKAKMSYGNDCDFINSNLIKFDKKLNGSFSIILIVNMLWYILEDLDAVVENILKYFDSKEKKILIIQNAFFKEEQNYGANIINGFRGAEDYFKRKLEEKVKIKIFNSCFKSGDSWTHDDGVITIIF